MRGAMYSSVPTTFPDEDAAEPESPPPQAEAKMASKATTTPSLPGQYPSHDHQGNHTGSSAQRRRTPPHLRYPLRR